MFLCNKNPFKHTILYTNVCKIPRKCFQNLSLPWDKGYYTGLLLAGFETTKNVLRNKPHPS